MDLRFYSIHGAINFAAVNQAALRRLPDLLGRWLPDGRRRGSEWIARNPRRNDRRPGSGEAGRD